MSQSQIVPRNRQENRQPGLLRARDEESEREQAAAGADMVAVLHPQRLMGNAALAGHGTTQATAAGGTEGVATIAQRIAPTIQPKMMLGPADDAYEREADAVADHVVQRLADGNASSVQRAAEEEEELQAERAGNLLATPVLQRAAEEEEELQAERAGNSLATPVLQRAAEEEEELQAERAGNSLATPVLQRAAEEEEELQAERAGNSLATPILQRAAEEEEELQAQRDGGSSAAGGQLMPEIEAEVDSARSGGAGLPASLQGGMEQSFGADFGNVRIHTGSEADTLNRKLNAKAFTTGNDIFFRGGEYNPESNSGRHLLAHELTHVVHQGGAPQVQPQRQDADPFFRS